LYVLIRHLKVDWSKPTIEPASDGNIFDNSNGILKYRIHNKSHQQTSLSDHRCEIWQPFHRSFQPVEVSWWIKEHDMPSTSRPILKVTPETAIDLNPNWQLGGPPPFKLDSKDTLNIIEFFRFKSDTSNGDELECRITFYDGERRKVSKRIKIHRVQEIAWHGGGEILA
jgi:hypothetical protein